MKKILLLLLQSFFFYTFISAQVPTTEFSNEQIKSIYSQVGPIHNNGLDHALEKLKEEYGSFYTGSFDERSKGEILNKLDFIIKDYVRTTLHVSGIDVWSWVKNIHQINNNDGEGLVSVVRKSETGQQLSDELFFALSDIENIMNDDVKRLNSNYYDAIVNGHIGGLRSFEEKAYLVSFASVANSSSSYWNENSEKWMEFFTKNKGENYINGRGRFPWNSVAAADVSGIVFGAMAGCALGAVGGTITLPIIGTIGGCAGIATLTAVGGGLGGSLKKAVEEFFEWLFSK